MRRLIWWGGLLSQVVLTACDAPVTGADPEATTWVASQSETAIAVIPRRSAGFPPPSEPGLEGVVVTYNDDTNNAGKILYEPNMRTVLRGASLLGWSYSEDAAATWTYGGKVLPPPGWAVLWGDPAIAQRGNDVWISNLAVPDSKYPPDGISGGLGPHLGGACIAQSNDRGKHFDIHSCVTNDEHFYDGGNMETTEDGSIWAAYWDVDTRELALWRSQLGGPFALVQQSPFESLDDPDTPLVEGSLVTHPRLRALRGTGITTPVLFLAAQVLEADGSVAVWFNEYIKDCATCGFHWGFPVRAVGNTTFQPTVNLSPWQSPTGPQARSLRAGPQFSFDVLKASTGGTTAVEDVRVVATRESSAGRKYVVGVRCPKGSSCAEVPGWTTLADGPSSQFNPMLRVNVGTPRIWKTSWLTTVGAKGTSGDVAVWHGNLQLGSGISPFPRLPLVAAHEVCSDTRGYWGDYDDLQVLQDQAGSAPLFVRAESDSDAGCVLRQTYNEQHLHVSATRFP